MKKISIALFSIVAMAGVASAQQAKGSGAGSASASAGVGVKAGPGAANYQPAAVADTARLQCICGAPFLRNGMRG